MAEIDLLTAFDDCVNRLHNGATIEQCLHRHPTHADQLRPMLETGQLVYRAILTDPEFATSHERMRQKVAQAVYIAPLPQPRPFNIVRWQGVAAVFLFVLFVGIVWAAQNDEFAINPFGRATATPSATITLTATTTPDPTLTPTPSPSATLSPTPSPSPTTPASSPTSTTPTACLISPRAGQQGVNVRTGGSTNHPIIDTLDPNTTYTAIGVNSANDGWYAIQLDAERVGWVASFVVDATGDCANLPLRTFAPAPTPAPSGDDGGSDDDGGGDDDNTDDDDRDDDIDEIDDDEIEDIEDDEREEDDEPERAED